MPRDRLAGGPTSAWSWASGPLIVAGSALLWVVVRHLNNDVLFAWAEVAEYRHWVFVPAGVKLVLAMVFGWRGALGVALGISTYLQGALPMLHMGQIAMLAGVLGFAPLLATRIFSRLTGLTRPWFGIQGYHLPLLVLLSACLCALSFKGLLVAFGVEGWEGAPARIATMMVGDFLGAGLFMVAVVGMRRLLRGSSQAS